MDYKDSPEGWKVALKFKIYMNFFFFSNKTFLLLEGYVRRSQGLGHTITMLIVYIFFAQFGTMVVESVLNSVYHK